MNSELRSTNDKLRRQADQVESSLMMMWRSAFRHKASHHHNDHHRVSSSIFLLLRVLAEHYRVSEMPITATELAEKLHVTPSLVSQNLGVLEEKRIIIRERSKDDRRITYVKLTSRGKKIAKCPEKRHRMSKTIEEFLNYLGPEDSEEFARLFGLLSEFLDDKTKNGEENV